MTDLVNEKKIRDLIEKEVEKKFKEIRAKEPITREDFLEAINSMNKRFEAVDRRFEEMFEAMNRGFMINKVAIDSLGQKSGIRLEKTILKLMQKILEKRDIDINKIEWIELFDEKGEVFSKNYRTDVDILIKNGLHFLMEVKYKADNRDIYHFIKVAELYSKKYRRPNKLILLTLDIDPKNLEYAENENIEVIIGDFP